jgi:hypothetical protein
MSKYIQVTHEEVDNKGLFGLVPTENVPKPVGRNHNRTLIFQRLTSNSGRCFWSAFQDTQQGLTFLQWNSSLDAQFEQQMR